MKTIYRIWTNGGNEGHDCKTFGEALRIVRLHEDAEWKHKEILITRDTEDNEGNIKSSNHVAKLNKTRHAKTDEGD